MKGRQIEQNFADVGIRNFLRAVLTTSNNERYNVLCDEQSGHQPKRNVQNKSPCNRAANMECATCSDRSFRHFIAIPNDPEAPKTAWRPYTSVW